MRWLLAIAFYFGLGAALHLPVNQPITYNYITQIANGVKEISNSFSVLRIEAQVTLQKVSSNEVTVSVNHIVVKQGIKLLNKPQELVSLEELSNLSEREIYEKITQELMRPFKVLLNSDSIIDKVFFNREEQLWSINLKKGLLNLLQVNYAKQHDVSTNQLQSSSSTWSKIVWEKSVAGKCKTLYDVRPSLNSEEEEMSDMMTYQVTKSTDFNLCEHPVDSSQHAALLWNTLWHTDDCTSSKKDAKHKMVVHHVTEYQVKGGSEGHILQAKSHSTHSMVPFWRSESATERIFSIQLLRKVAPSSSPQPLSLRTEEMQEDLAGLRLVHETEVQTNSMIIKKTVRKIVHQMAQQINSETYRKDKFLQDTVDLIEMCKHLSKDDLMKLINLEGSFSIPEMTEQWRKNLIEHLVDILPSIPTNKADEVIVELLKQRMQSSTQSTVMSVIKGPRAAMLVQNMAAISRVDRKMLRVYLDLVSDPQFQQFYNRKGRSQVYKSTWLGVGALFNIYFAKQEGIEAVFYDPKILDKTPEQMVAYRQQLATDNESLKSEFVRIVNQMLSKHGQRLLALKVIKNSGLFKFFPAVKSLFRQLKSKKDRYLRSECIYALSKMVQMSNSARIKTQVKEQQEQHVVSRTVHHQEWLQQVREIRTHLLNVFTNEIYDPQLRIDAYRVLIESRPETTMLQIIVNQMLSERSQQVYSYVRRHLSQFAETQHLCYKKLATRIRPLISMLLKNETEREYSTYRQFPMWIRTNKMGAIVETDVIFSDKSFAPRRTHVKADLQIMGCNIQLVEFGIHTEGLQELMEASLGPDGRLRREYTSDVSPESPIRSLRDESDPLKTEQLNIQPRQSRETPRLHAYLSKYGYEVTFWEPSQSMIRTLQKEGKLDISSFTGFSDKQMQYTSATHGYSRMATPVGFFAEIHASVLAYNKITTSLKLSESSTSKMGFTVSAKPHSHIFVLQKLRANLNVINFVTNMVAQINLTPEELKVSASVDWSKHVETKSSIPRIQINWAAPQDLSTLLTVKSSMNNQIVCIKLNSESGIQMIKTTKIIQHRQSLRPTIVNFQNVVKDVSKFLGMRFDIDAKYHSVNNIISSQVWGITSLMGPTEITMKVANQHVENEEIKPSLVSMILFPLNYRKVDSYITPLMVQVLYSKDVSFKAAQMLPIRIPKSQLREVLVIKTDTYYEHPIKWNVIQNEILIINTYNRQSAKMIRVSSKILLPMENVKFMEQLTFRNLVQTHRKLDISTQISYITSLAVPDVLRNREPLTKKVFASQPQKQILLSKVVFRVPQELIQVGESNTLEQLTQAWPLLLKCLHESTKSTNGQTGPNCLRLYTKLNQLSEVMFHVTYEREQLPPKVITSFSYIYNAVRDLLKPYRKQSVFTNEVQPSISIKWSSSPFTKKIAQLEIKTPFIDEKYSNIRLPFTPFYWSGISSFTEELQSLVFGKGSPATCRHIGNQIETVDGVSYTIPKSLFEQIKEKNCPVLLARDCSSKKKFQVLLRQMTNSAGRRVKVVHVEVNQQIFEFVQEIGENSKVFTVIRNGQIIPQLNEINKNQIEMEFINSEKTWQKIQLYRESHESENGQVNVYKLLAVNLGLKVILIPQKIELTKIIMSPFFNNRICGLCGDYNYESKNEFDAPNPHISYRTPEKFVRSYVTPLNDQCQQIRKESTSIGNKLMCRIESEEATIRTFTQKHISLATALQRQSLCSVVIFEHETKNIKITDSTSSSTIYKDGTKVAVITKTPSLSVKIFSSDSQLTPVRSIEQSVQLPGNVILKVVKDSSSYPSQITIKLYNSNINLLTFRQQATHQTLDIHESLLPEARGICKRLTSDVAQNPALFYDQFSEKGSECMRTKQNLISCKILENTLEPFLVEGESQNKEITFTTPELSYYLRKADCPILLASGVLHGFSMPVNVFLRIIKDEGKLKRKFELHIGHPQENPSILSIIQSLDRDSSSQKPNLKMSISGRGPINLERAGVIQETIKNVNVKIVTSNDVTGQVDVTIPGTGFVLTLNNQQMMLLRFPSTKNSNRNNGLCNIDKQVSESQLSNPVEVLSKAISHVLESDILSSEDKSKCQSTMMNIPSSNEDTNRVCKIKRNGQHFKFTPFLSTNSVKLQSMVSETLQCPFVLLEVPEVLKITATVTTSKTVIRIVDLRQAASSNIGKTYKTIKITQSTSSETPVQVTVDDRPIEGASVFQVIQNQGDRSGLIEVNRNEGTDSSVNIKLDLKDSFFSDRYIPITVTLKQDGLKSKLTIFTPSIDAISDSICRMKVTSSSLYQWSTIFKSYLDNNSQKEECMNRFM